MMAHARRRNASWMSSRISQRMRSRRNPAASASPGVHWRFPCGRAGGGGSEVLIAHRVGADATEGRMDVGIGLPNTVPGTGGTTLTGWAARAEQAGFSTLGTIGRLVYASYEELVALPGAAAVTTRIH